MLASRRPLIPLAVASIAASAAACGGAPAPRAVAPAVPRVSLVEPTGFCFTDSTDPGNAAGAARLSAVPLEPDDPTGPLGYQGPASAPAGPGYPAKLRDKGIEGSVRIEWVTDTLGRTELSTLRVLRSTHRDFSAVTCRWLAGARLVARQPGARLGPLHFAQSFSWAIVR